MTPLDVSRLAWRSSTGMQAHPARTFEEEARKRERVRCSSLVDWPVYPRLRRTMQGSERLRNLVGIIKIAATHGVGVGTVQRIKAGLGAASAQERP